MKKMNFNDVLGWIGNILFIYGVYAIGIQQIDGFYSNILANICYIVQAKRMKNNSLFWLSILLVILNLKGIYEWSL